MALALGIINGKARCTEIELSNSPYYFHTFGGVNWANSPKLSKIKYKTSKGCVVGAAVGRHFEGFAIEAEYSHRHNETCDVNADLGQHAGIISAVAELPMAYHISPYAGIGVGYRFIKLGEKHHEFGIYQLRAGVNLALTEKVKLFADYRFMDGFRNNECVNQDICGGLKVSF